MNRNGANVARAMCALLSVFSSIASGQVTAGDRSVRHEIFPNSVADNYLRYLQTVGKVPLYPWSSRPFSQRELSKLLPKDSVHPWAERFEETPWGNGGVSFGFIQPATSLRFNSAFPYGFNDGPVWAGRGLTSSLQAGFFAEWGPVTLTVAPMSFRAENSDFDIIATGRPGAAAFGDPNFVGVDRPQRFGNSAYTQVDPGQSTLRVDFPFVMAGASTGNQEWGPGQELPVILGNNAAGFPHLFVGTSEPVDLFIAKIHAKLMWGELFQSDYSSVTGPSRYFSRLEPGTKRFTTGI
ncbi:MAG TPA: hypothetical protein VFD22_05795, partial [Gemmatimonadaceae bacterium]|nr:hypothetical protein [Gemmatimonadaceae bacterium]